MYLLLERAWSHTLQGSGAIIGHTYPAFVLVKMDRPPQDVPITAYEVLDEITIRVHGQAVDIPDGQFHTEGEPRTLIRFIGPIAAVWHQALKAAGVEVLF